MAKWVALMRGINVGGKNKLPMKELRTLFERAGCTDVRTCIQSGNVVFSAPAVLAKKVPLEIPKAIKKNFGLQVPVVMRSAAAFKKAASNNPFAKGDFDPRLVMIGFLSDKPTAALSKTLDPKRAPDDSFRVVGSEIHLHYPKGSARSKLTTAYVDRCLNTVCTVRNWNTVQKIIALCQDT